MAHLTRPAEISGVSAGSFPETAAGNRAYHNRQRGKTQSSEGSRGPIKVGEGGEFGKYGDNDNFATIPNEEKHKAVKGAHKSWRKRPIWQIRR